ncbi:MAG TPA: tetratricopeptide repeat protein, partial [Candidatus Eisenbacteria bacterium]
MTPLAAPAAMPHHRAARGAAPIVRTLLVATTLLLLMHLPTSTVRAADPAGTAPAGTTPAGTAPAGTTPADTTPVVATDWFKPLRDQQAAFAAQLPAAGASRVTVDNLRAMMATGRLDEAAGYLGRVDGDPATVTLLSARVQLMRQDFDAVRGVLEPIVKSRRALTDDEKDLVHAWFFAGDNSPEVAARTAGIDVSSHGDASVADLLAAGRLSYQMLNFDRAESCFTSALAVAGSLESRAPFRAAALRGLGLVQYRRRDFDGAIAFHERAMKTLATPEVLLASSETLIRLGRTDEAISCAEWAVKLNRYHDGAHYYLGNGYARKNYSELATAYPANFADAAGREAMTAADRLLENGRRDEARDAYVALRKAHPAWADVAIRLASFEFEEGRYAAARDLCFAALDACPEYGRAHATLAKALEFQRFDIDIHRREYEARFAAMPMPDLPGIDRYVANWKSLSPRHQKRVALSVEPWKNFLPVLLEGGCTHYIKPLYQRLSETPGLETLRDQRISYDSRLWDDVRGAGGYNTVTGLEDVERTIFDRYNTVLHELTHQVHGVTTADQGREIQELYRKAKERDEATRNGFLSRYAGGSVYEYFAEGANALKSKKRDAYDSREEVYERLDAMDPELMTLVRKFMALADLEPNYPIAYVNAGQDKVGKGEVDAGIVYFDKAL